MANTLKPFKKKILNSVINTEVLPAIDESKNMPEIIANSSNNLGIESVKLLDQLEKAGFTEIASKLKELQLTEGLAQLDPHCERLKLIESKIDELLQLGYPMDTEELKGILAMTVDTYQARARALLLPYGTVSPRTAMQGRNNGSNQVNIALGIGNGISPKTIR